MIKKFKKHHLLHISLIFISIMAVLGGAFVLWMSSIPLPDFNSFEQRKISESTKIFDNTGEVLLFDVHKDIKRTIVPLEEMSRHVKNATIAIEDSEFYEHRGVKPTAILRAFFANIAARETVQGGSTLTQQVIKNTLLSKEQRITRKIKEAVLAIKLEQVMEKDAILEIYLNEAPYGGSLYGVEEASLAFFGKKAKDITLAESAYLAALPKAPTYYSPYGNNIDRLEARKNTVLMRMKELGFITEEEYTEAQEEEVLFSAVEEQQIKAPHFVLFVRDYLERVYGADAIETQGLRVITTLDWNLQQKGEEIIKENGESNAENFDAHNAALVALDPQNGKILTMVGSRDWFSESKPEECISGATCKFDPKVNIATRKPGRQPGSSFKPFVYATLLEKGYTPETILFDIKTQFSTACDPFGNPFAGSNPTACYTPQNYDFVYRGPMTVRDALAQSINVPAVKALYLAGLRDSLENAKDFGITTLTDINRYGLTLVLGGGETTLLEMTNAYGVFASEGIQNPYAFIERIEDAEGRVLEEFIRKSQRVVDEEVSRTITDILSDNDARAPSYGYNSPLYFDNNSVAAKTGTTNDFRDAWIVGYTPNTVVGVWAGNSDNSSMDKKVAGFIVAPMWREFILEVLEERPANKTFTKPQIDFSLSEEKPVLRGEWRGSETYTIDTISQKLATEYTPEETKEEKVVTDVHSILHWVDRNNPRGDIPKNPITDPQYILWETGVQTWAATEGIVNEEEDVIPEEFDDIHTLETLPKVSIEKPTTNTLYKTTDTLFVELSTESTYPIEQIDFFINDSFEGSVHKQPFRGVLPLSIIDGLKKSGEENILTVRVYDSVKNQVQVSIPFLVE